MDSARGYGELHPNNLEMIILSVLFAAFYAVSYGIREWYLLKASQEDEEELADLLMVSRAFFSKEHGWKRKWKDGDQEKGPAFWGSSTVFVAVTEFTKLSQFIQNLCLDMAIASLLVYASRDWFIAVFSIAAIRTFRWLAVEFFVGNMRRVMKEAWSWVRVLFATSPYGFSFVLLAVAALLIAGIDTIGPLPTLVIFAAVLVVVFVLVRVIRQRIKRRSDQDHLRNI